MKYSYIFSINIDGIENTNTLELFCFDVSYFCQNVKEISFKCYRKYLTEIPRKKHKWEHPAINNILSIIKSAWRNVFLTFSSSLISKITSTHKKHYVYTRSSKRLKVNFVKFIASVVVAAVTLRWPEHLIPKKENVVLCVICVVNVINLHPIFLILLWGCFLFLFYFILFQPQ